MRPQLAEMVFHRRASDTQAMTRIEFADDGCCAAGRILDRLRFVEDQHVIVVLLQLLGIAPHERIRSQDNVMFREWRRSRAAGHAK